jgi:hypothetical protein
MESPEEQFVQNIPVPPEEETLPLPGPLTPEQRDELGKLIREVRERQ